MPQADTGSGDAAVKGLRRQVFGFLPYWTLADSTTVLDYNYLSTIAYFSVGADRLGNLLKRQANGQPTTGWGGWTSKRMTSVINAAHAHHTRVVLTISVFAWTSGEAAKQRALLGSPSARRNLARQAAAAVRDRGADGINLDFEPIVSGHAADFTAFVRTLRKELDRVHRGYQLTFDTTGWIGNYPIEDATRPGGADAIFIMGYDYRGSGVSTVGSIDPITGTGYSLDDTIRAYTARVPASKLILGLPYYGRAWSTTTSGLHAENQSGTKYGTSNAVTYQAAAALMKLYGRRYDAKEGVTWFSYRRKSCTSADGCVMTWRQVYFDDAQSLKARYDLVVRSRLRGAGIWALGYEGRDRSLYGAISLKFLHDTTPPEAGIAILPSTIGDAGFVVAWRAVDDSAIRSYDVQVSVDGGAWAAWRTGTKATSDVFLGADGHGYAFRVRATDAYRNVGAWDVAARYDATPTLAVGGFGRVRIDGVSARVSPDTSALKVATLSAGQVLAIIGGPVGADGYTWYQVTGPLSEWNTVAFTRSGIWVPVRDRKTSFVAAAQAPGATRVAAVIAGLRIGSGTSAAGPPQISAFSPNGDHSGDTLRLTWRNRVTLDSMSLRVYRLNGAFVGSRTLARTKAGDQTYDWDGLLPGAGRLADGRYVLQLVGKANGRTFTAPSVRPLTPSQIAVYSAVVDRVAPPITSLSASGSRISPNGDGRFDRVTFSMTATGGVAWDFSVARLTGTKVGPPVRTAAGSGPRAIVTWNGTASGGAVVPDGRYRVTLRVADAAGNRSVRSGTLIVDSRPAAIAATVAPSPVSPNGDKAADTAVAPLGQRRGGPGDGLDPARIPGRPRVGVHVPRRWRDRLERPGREGPAGPRWRLPRPHRRHRRDRQPHDRGAAARRRPDRGLPALVAPGLRPAGRRRDPADVALDLPAHAGGQGEPGDRRRPRHRGPDRVGRARAAGWPADVDLGRPRREWCVRRARRVHRGPQRHVAARHLDPAPAGLRRCLPGDAIRHDAQGRHDPDADVPGRRGAPEPPDGHVPPAGARGGRPDRDPARRRALPGDLHGPPRQRAGIRAHRGHRRQGPPRAADRAPGRPLIDRGFGASPPPTIHP